MTLNSLQSRLSADNINVTSSLDRALAYFSEEVLSRTINIFLGQTWPTWNKEDEGHLYRHKCSPQIMFRLPFYFITAPTT